MSFNGYFKSLAKQKELYTRAIFKAKNSKITSKMFDFESLIILKKYDF